MGLAACFLALSVGAALGLAALGCARRQVPREAVPVDVTPVVDQSLYPRLLQAAVRIVPEGGARGGCGILVDRQDRLVVTVAPVVGNQTRARVYAATGEQAGVAGRLVARNQEYGLVLLRLERLPEGAAPLSLAERWPSPSRSLHSLQAAEAEAGSPQACRWSYSSGTPERVIMKAHFCTAAGPNTPWLVIMQPQGKFCDTGAPVVNDQGALVALGAPAAGNQGFLARLIDVGAIHATLHDWSEQQQDERRTLSQLLGSAL